LISCSASFQSLGFDSLRAAELHQRLVQMTGLPLSITMLWNYPSIDEFADALVTMMQSGGEAPFMPADALPTTPPPSGSALPPRTSLDDMLNEVAALSEADVDAFFRHQQRDTAL
jgi:aryl carrier-like protein